MRKMLLAQITFLSMIFIFLFFLFEVTAAPVLNPTNGHYYELIDKYINWDDANNEALSMTCFGFLGHLATIEEYQENIFLTSTYGADSLHLHWLGAIQQDGSKEPDGGWMWTTGENIEFFNWSTNEPNNYNNTENRIIYDHGQSDYGKEWNDCSDSAKVKGYVVEFDTDPSIIQDYTTFQIGEIPYQNAFHGKTLSFIVLSDQLLSLNISNLPKGAILFEESTGFFSYTPSIDDKEPFMITFTGYMNGKSVSQQIDITPIPSLPYENLTFGLEPIHSSDDTDSDYIKKDITISNEPEIFNYSNGITRKISISGKKLVFEQGHMNNLYDDYNNNKDIKELNVYAETLIIRNMLKLPQTNVTIYAKELRFEDGIEIAAINTSGLSKSDENNPGNNEDGQGKDGENGLNAGNIVLYINTIFPELNSNTEKRFIMKGGKGQNPGPGVGCIDGKNIADTYSHEDWSDSIDGHVVYGEIFTRECFMGICGNYEFDHSFGTSSWPTSATPGHPAGKPGNGGNGGFFQSNMHLSGYLNNVGGVSGERGTSYSKCIGGKPSPAYWYNWKGHWYEDRSSTTTDAPALPAPFPDILSGNNGNISTVNSSISWLSPFALRIVINHAKDAYLYKRNSEYAKEVFEKYTKILDTYSSLNEWNLLSEEWRCELNQMNYEMKNYLHRIDSHLDYFGNPAGWVPMLSLESTKTLYESEIQHAFRVLYLSYWIKNAGDNIKNKIDGMTAARTQIKSDIEYFKEAYNTAIDKIPQLQLESNRITTEVETLQIAIKDLEDNLVERIEESNKVPTWKKVAQAAAKICKLCPIGQPYLGAIGVGLDVAVKYDPDKPLESIFSSTNDAVKEYNNSKFKDKADTWNSDFDKIKFSDFPDSIDEAKAYFKQFQPLANQLKPLGQELQNLKDVFKDSEVPKDFLEEELQKLKAESPEFKDLLDKVNELMKRKEQFYRNLTENLQAVSSLSNNISQSLLTIDELNREISDKKEGLDQRTLMYLDEMERRAKERLLKYHYYMAKAYEYRMLEEYKEELNLDKLLEKCKTMAESASGVDLSASDFETLRTIYEIPIHNIKEIIIDKYNLDARKEETTYRLFDLSADEIQKLNAAKPITVNLLERAKIKMSDENVRIKNIEIMSLQAHLKENADGYYTSRYRIEHDGVSKLSMDGVNYQFIHYNDSDANPISWKAEYHKSSNGYEDLHTVFESDATKSLLSIFLGENNTLFYSRPAAWANVTITKTEGEGIVIDSMSVKVTYDFFERYNFNILGLYVMKPEKGLNPYIILNTKDINGLQDGKGTFRRSFYKGDDVTLKAPSKYGSWKFDGWDIISGDISKRILRKITTQTVHVTLNQDLLIQPKYVYEKLGDINGDAFISIQDAILTLKIVCEMDTTNTNISADINRDNKIGMAEVIYIIKKISELNF